MHASIAARPTRPSRDSREVGTHTFIFEAFSGLTRVTAHWIAQPQKPPLSGVFGSTRYRAARQMQEQSTNLWAEPISTAVTRLRSTRKITEWLWKFLYIMEKNKAQAVGSE